LIERLVIRHGFCSHQQISLSFFLASDLQIKTHTHQFSTFSLWFC
jgi:hypothetical protein